MSAQQSDFRLGKCRWCEERKDVYRDNSLCEECDSNVIHCHVCKTDQHSDDPCRHCFRDRNYEWSGAGCAARGDDMMIPFHRLLSAMGEDFARDLKIAIKSGQFYTWMIAPIIGGGGCFELHGMPERDGRWMVHTWGDKMIELGSGDRAEKLHDGYRWLVSLYKTDTTVANRTTIAWIDRWLWPLTPFR